MGLFTVPQLFLMTCYIIIDVSPASLYICISYLSPSCLLVNSFFVLYGKHLEFCVNPKVECFSFISSCLALHILWLLILSSSTYLRKCLSDTPLIPLISHTYKPLLYHPLVSSRWPYLDFYLTLPSHQATETHHIFYFRFSFVGLSFLCDGFEL